MNKKSNSVRIGIAVAVILGTIGWLAYSGYGSSKSYFVTVAELGNMGNKAYHSNLRVEGFVKPGSIQQDGPHVTFLLDEFESHSPKAATGRVIKVVYNGSEPPPDTFKDDAMAIAMGTLNTDGVFHANQLQAKCASKYAPQQPGQKPAAPAEKSPATPNSTASVTPNTVIPAH
jgi:cytochrome c-type biogenesis protein CcmE